MKIVTLTLSPAYDVHCKANKITPGEENFITLVERNAGGKGINISRALTVNGVDNLAILAVGDANGADFCRELDKDGMRYEAIELAVKAEHGNRHTAHMHSKNIDHLTRFARAVETTIFVKNGPSYAGIGVGGMGYTTFTIAGPTGEGLTSAKSFARKRRCVLVGGFDIR